MSLTNTVTVWCNGTKGEHPCPVWVYADTPKRSKARAEMRLAGWTCKRVDGETKDFCPECSKENKTKK